MSNVYHILNGDALKEQFPIDLVSGELIVLRECLVDGEVRNEPLESFFQTRANTLSKLYEPSETFYFEHVAPEIGKIPSIAEGEVNLWFEDDLFCQVNLWFACSLLKDRELSINLVRPTSTLQYGFGGMSQDALHQAYLNRTSITASDVNFFSELWEAYANHQNELLAEKGQVFQSKFPFLKEAIRAQLDRAEGVEKPQKVLQEIIEEVGPDFRKVFPEFSRRAPIYGFGDLQVKRLFDELISK